MTKWDQLVVEEHRPPGTAVVVYRLRGHLTADRTSYALLETIQRTAHDAVPRVVINLSGVDRITSAGIGILAASFTAVSRAKGAICITGAQGTVERVLELVHLSDVVSHAESEEEGVRTVSA